MKRCISAIRVMLITGVIAAGCAKQSAPTGGPKDETPPRIVKSEPLNGTVNFTGNSISVTFDEYIVLDKISEKFMVSPPMKVKPDITLKGKTLNVVFKEELKDSSTYTLYFQDAIRDLNENNPLNNFQIVFSTGNVLDSLSVTGNVFTTPDLEAAANVLVMLHSNLADTSPVRSLPDYITLADRNGIFRIDNVKGGEYRIFALLDNNNNKRYDLSDEGIAFLDTIVRVDPFANHLAPLIDTIPSKLKDSIPVNRDEGMYNLHLFRGPQKKYYLTSSDRKAAYKFIYSISLPPDTLGFSFAIADSTQKDYILQRNKTGDTLTVWLRDSTLYSMPQIRTIITYPFTDSSGFVIPRSDTIPMRFTSVKPARGKQVKAPLKISTNIINGALRPGQKIRFLSETPLSDPDTSRIMLFEPVTGGRKIIPYQLLRDSGSLMSYTMTTLLKEETRYTLIYDRAAFRDIYGTSSDSTGIKFGVNPKKAYGHLFFKIDGASGNMIVQLLDTREKIVARKTITQPGTVSFPYLDKGKYRARIIFDLNNDGSWTTGDYDLKKQPEPVFYFPDEIDIKIDWESEYNWTVKELNFKNQKLRQKPSSERR
jgi:uncharacterized protein (DUF2141 family)